MAQQTINVGAAPNDGTGDTLRTAFTKTQNNFSEFYAAMTPTLSTNNVQFANTLTIGNSTVNSTINSTSWFFGNSTANAVSNSTYEGVANATAATVVQPGIQYLGNSTVNTNFTATSVNVINSTANSVLTSQGLVVKSPAANVYFGNSTVGFLTVNTTAVQVSGTNTFNLGTANVAGHTAAFANGYIRLPNGLIMGFGQLATANTTAQVVTLATAYGVPFTSNIFAVQATSNNASTIAAVTAANSTSITILTNNATACAVYWQVIGV